VPGASPTTTDDRGSRRRLAEAAVVLLVAVLVSSLLTFRLSKAVDADSDQSVINLLVLKLLHPERLPRDAFYGRDYGRFYVPLYVRLQALLSSDGNYTTGLQRLGAGIGVLFSLSHYVFFRAMGTGAIFAGLGTLSVMTLRPMFGADYWGFNGLQSMLPREVVNALTPLLLLAFLRWRAPWQILRFFLLTGIVVSFHPYSGLHLFLAGALAHLIIERGERRAWLEVIAGTCVFVLGALPFLVGFVPGRENLRDPALLPALREIQWLRWRFEFLPPTASEVGFVALGVLLPAGLLVWLWRTGGANQEVKRLFAVGAAAVGGAFLGTAAIQLWARLTNGAYLTTEHIRMAKFVYPALLVAFPLAYVKIWGTGARPGSRAAVVILVALSLVSPQQLLVATSRVRTEAKKKLGLPVAPQPPARVDPDESALWDWARRETSVDALFFTDSTKFRVATERSITGTWKDAGFVSLAGTRALYDWYQFISAVERCRAKGGEHCWFTLAQAAGADFAIVDPGVPKSQAADGFIKVWEQGTWSVWKRVR
jgi:hypothetical protein